MRLRIKHRTTLRYDHPVSFAIQSLRMMPRGHAGQRIEEWSVTVVGRRLPLVGYLDGYGNWVHQHSRNAAHELTEIVVSGLVDLADRAGIVAGTEEPLPPFFYLRQTGATEADEAVKALAHSAGGGSGPIDRLEQLTAVVAGRVACTPHGGAPQASAPGTLDSGSGSVADVVHLMLACTRALGFPARYVSGYRHDGDGSAQRDAPHAWIEAHVPEQGWVALDPIAGERVADRHVRVAAGLDWLSAAPIRGLWRGAAEEAQTMAVQVAAAEMTQ